MQYASKQAMQNAMQDAIHSALGNDDDPLPVVLPPKPVVATALTEETNEEDKVSPRRPPSPEITPVSDSSDENEEEKENEQKEEKEEEEPDQKPIQEMKETALHQILHSREEAHSGTFFKIVICFLLGMIIFRLEEILYRLRSSGF